MIIKLFIFQNIIIWKNSTMLPEFGKMDETHDDASHNTLVALRKALLANQCSGFINLCDSVSRLNSPNNSIFVLEAKIVFKFILSKLYFPIIFNFIPLLSNCFQTSINS